LRTVRDVMTVHGVYVEPATPVHSAVLLMRTNGLLTLPVVEDGTVVGVVDAATLFMYQPDILIGDIMAAAVAVEADASLSSAAALLRAHGLAEIPVVDGNLAGTLKASELLAAWAMPVDPLTGLPWQDSFRLRSSMELNAGKELTLLFFDMDDFGALNKRSGHIVGDRALKSVAEAIRTSLDVRYDQACRYGGDEFVVSTTRPRPQAVEWATAVRQTIRQISVEGMDGNVGVSVGVAGGLRQGERPGTHGPATLDDLINRASQASTLAKANGSHVMSLDHDVPHATAPRAHEATERANRIRIRSVQTYVDADRVHADVRLEHRGLQFSGGADGDVASTVQVVAEAAASALACFLPATYRIRPTSVTLPSVPEHGRVAMAVVSMDGPHGRQNLVGVADVVSDPNQAAVKAVLDAVNRPLEVITLGALAAERLVDGVNVAR